MSSQSKQPKHHKQGHKQPKGKGPAPVAGVVHTIFASAKSVNEQKRVNPLSDRHAADMTSALTYAAQALARAEEPVVEEKLSPLQRVLASIGLSSKKAAGASKRGAPQYRATDKARIEDVLKSSTTGGALMSLEEIVKAEQKAANEGVNCHLPDGAVDPVCEPR
ncbi:MAG: hypothetical protein GC190_11660 [Alphaproteobacteria bacterium]|nr:hypothetical protein [Alphaproteobacteria bacterium]